MSIFNAVAFYRALAAWFAEQSRDLPWRRSRTPYRVWISEIMLQQTQVATVIPYYERWMERWPSLQALAAAREDEVLKAWEGLGYYSRARNILRTARELHEQGAEDLPGRYAELIKLKGIGPYTAGAIASLAGGEVCAAVDGNVLRAASRLWAKAWQAGVQKDQAACRRHLNGVMTALSDASENFSPGLFNEALIELGALVCKASAADCPACPVRNFCLAYKKDLVASYPLPAKRTKQSHEEYTVLILRDDSGRLAVRKRPGEGLLASLWEFPLLDGRREAAEVQNRLEEAGLLPLYVEELQPRRHVFSHLIWNLYPFYAEVSRPAEPDAALLLAEQEAVYAAEEVLWLSPDELKALAFSSALAGLRDYYVLS